MAAESARSEQRNRRPAASEPAEDDVPARLADEGINPVELDRLIHGRVRLGIVSALAVNDSLSFSELRDLLDTSDGNLSVHARRLEEAGYLACTKSFAGRTPLTEYRLTDSGRGALEKYLDHMEALIDRVRES
jgi:DNA-binding MarR family transcriptional regulator